MVNFVKLNSFTHCLLVILIKDVGCKSGIIVDFKFHNLSLHFLEALGRTFGRKDMEVLPSPSLVPPPLIFSHSFPTAFHP